MVDQRDKDRTGNPKFKIGDIVQWTNDDITVITKIAAISIDALEKNEPIQYSDMIHQWFGEDSLTLYEE